MFNFRNFVLFLTLLTLATVTAGASTIEFVTFNNGGSYTNAGGISVGPYSLFLTDLTGVGSPFGPYNINGPCISDNLTVSGGETWYATESKITDFSAPVQTNLKEMAWLDTRFAFANTNATVAPIQQAIWDLGNQLSGTTQLYTDAATEAWLTTAAASYGAGTTAFYSQFSVLIPNNPNTSGGTPYDITSAGKTGSEPQFFLLQTSNTLPPPPPVPEPATYLMIGGALIGLGCVGNKRRKT